MGIEVEVDEIVTSTSATIDHLRTHLPEVDSILAVGAEGMLEELRGAGFEATAWQSVLAPAKTPAPIVERLSIEIRKALDDPDFRKDIEKLGAIPYGTTPREFQTFLAAEVEKWGQVIRASGATAE